MKVHRVLTEAPEGTVPFKLPASMLNNPERIDLKGLAASTKAASDREEAERKHKEELAKNREKYAELITKVSEIADPEKKLEALFEELVPSSGTANTLAGELVRAMMRILYRDYNDGDLFYEGYGIETCSSSVAFLIDKIDDLYSDFEKIAERRLDEGDYTAALDAICDKVCKYILTTPDVWQENTEDSRGSEYEQMYEDRYLSDWEPEYDYDFQIPPTIQEYIDAGHIIVDEFIEEVKSALDNNWSIKYDDVEDAWSDYIQITGLKKEGYDEVESWKMWEDSAWSDYIDELVDEYGDLEDTEEEEEDIEESVDTANFKVGDKALYHGKNTRVRGVEHNDEFGYDYLIDNPDYSPERYPGRDSWKFKRIWVGSDIEPVKERLVESADEQVIIGFSADGTRSYYNEQEKAWMDSAKNATVYPNVDDARNVWFTLDKKPFKRVFVVCNTPGI